MSKITKNDFSFPTGQKSFKDIQYPGAGRQGCPNLPYFAFPALGFLSPISPVFSKLLKSKVPF